MSSRQAETWRRAKLRDQIAYAAIRFVEASDAYEKTQLDQSLDQTQCHAAVTIARRELIAAVRNLRPRQ